jgi:hypothetical protein
MAAKWQKFRVSVPSTLSTSERVAVSREVIEFVQTRSENGFDKNDNKFVAYSKEYIKSLDFKVAGKSPGEVNLTLSGEMLIALDLLSHKRGSLLIGYENGSDENARADGNVRGTYGKSSGNKRKARDFMGIDQDTIDKIVNKVTGT